MKNHVEEDPSSSFEHLFDQFVRAATCKTILSCFHQLRGSSRLPHVSCTYLYEELKAKLKGSWRAESLFSKLDKRAANKDYKKGNACSNIKVLIIGAGPCGLRTAIECAFLGAKTVVVEKRERFSRNNVLHLWPYLISDLKNLGAKKFFGKFCAGAIDHISIRQLQCILLKVALLVGVEVHVNVTFDGLVEPSEDSGWKCKVTPKNHVVSDYEFDVLICADGKRNTLSGFKRKEFRGKLALAVTANFINRNTQAEARVEEISGVAFIFNQKFFLDLKENTGIDLENIVYYKDDTHYFVMTAKKASLLEKGVLKDDLSDTVALLDKTNVNQEALMAYAREAADFSTHYQLPSLEYAVNHYGQADVAMFDFTSMFAVENASKFIVKNGHHLLMGLVGDSLLEPFWPTGSGCARGFLGAFDAAWMIRSWAMGKTPLQVLVERESIYTLLSQTTPGYLNKNYNMYSIDPNTRYLNLNLKAVKPNQVRHLYEGGVFDNLAEKDHVMAVPSKKPKSDAGSTDSRSLLEWCQKVLNTGIYQGVHVVDFTSSWRSGLAICALIHSYRPDLIDYTRLSERDVAANNQLAFSLAEKDLGIPPMITSEDMARCAVPDKLTMISYLTQFYDLFRHDPVPVPIPLKVTIRTAVDVKKPNSARRSNRRVSILQKLNSRIAKSKKRKEQEKNEGRALRLQKCKELIEDEEEHSGHSKWPMENVTSQLQMLHKKDVKLSKGGESPGAVSVAAMTDILIAKFQSQEGSPIESVRKLKSQASFIAAASASEVCYFCQKRVYIMERVSAEGQFFHRGCLKCDHCGMGLRLSNYSCDKDVKPVKFYCYRHAIPEMRVRPQRKRLLEENNIPDVVITPAEQLSKGKLNQKNMNAHPTPVIKTSNLQEGSKYTPERVEFEISFDGIEESEEEQFVHNLRASQSDIQPDEDTDSESSNSDINSSEENMYLCRTNTVGEACAFSGSLKEQHSTDINIDIPQRSSTTNDIIRTTFEKLFCDVKENFSINTVKDVRKKKLSQDVNRVADKKMLTNKDVHSILKDSGKKLKVNDKSKESVFNNKSEVCTELLKNDELREPQEKSVAKKLVHDAHCSSVSNNSACENLPIESSCSGNTGVFIEGHLSPSANRTRRFRIKRHTNKQQILFSELSDSKKNNTNPAAVDQFQPYSVMSKLDLPAQERTSSKTQSNSAVGTIYDATAKHERVRGMMKLQGENNSHQKVMESLTENSVSDSLAFRNVDDRFVTDRRHKHINKVTAALRKESKSLLDDVEKSAVDSSFSISTPSDTESSVSSVELDESACSSVVSGVGHMKPYKDRIIQDFSPTSNLAPRVSYNMRQASIGANVAGNKNLLQVKLENDCNNNNNKCEYSRANENAKASHIFNNSVCITPDGSTKDLKKTAGTSGHTKIFLTRPLPPPGSNCPQSDRSLSSTDASTIQYSTPVSHASCNNTTPSSKTRKQNSSGKDIILSTASSNVESQFVNKRLADYALSSKHAVFTTLPNQLEDSPHRVKPLTSLLAKGSTDQPVKYSASKVNSGVSLIFPNQQGSSTVRGTKTALYKTSATDKLDDMLSNCSVLSKHTLAATRSQSQIPDVIEDKRKQKLDVTRHNPHGMDTKKKIIAEDAITDHDVDISVLDDTNEELYTCASKRNVESRYLDRNGVKAKSDKFFASNEKMRAMCLTGSSENHDTIMTVLPSSKVCNKGDPIALSSQQIRDNCRADIEKVRTQARCKAKLKTDEELGISTVGPAYSSKEHVLNRHSPGRINSHSLLDKSCDTISISGIVSSNNCNFVNKATINETQSSQSCQPSPILSKKNNVTVMSSVKSSDNGTVPILSVQSFKPDSHLKCKMTNDLSGFGDKILDGDKNSLFSTQTAVSAVTEGDQTTQQACSKGKKNKLKFSKTKKEIKDNESEKKGKSFLSLFGLTKVKKKGTEHCNVTLSPDSLLQDGDFNPRNKSKNKVPKKKNEKKAKSSKNKAYCLENQDTASEYSKNLSVFSVFHSDSNKQAKNLLDVRPSIQTTALTSRSHVNDRSDSDDNYICHSPMGRRKTQTLDERVAQRLHRINQKQQKQAEQKRLRMAQELQRQLEEVEVRGKDLEERGVVVEKALRGDCHEADSENQLMSEWFTLVIEKNALLRYESELLVRAKELELEDRQTRLEFEFRERSKQSDKTKTESDLATEESLLEELLDVVEQRNSLVTMLEEDRLREQKEDNELKEMMAKEGYVLSSLSFDTWQERKTT